MEATQYTNDNSVNPMAVRISGVPTPGTQTRGRIADEGEQVHEAFEAMEMALATLQDRLVGVLAPEGGTSITEISGVRADDGPTAAPLTYTVAGWAGRLAGLAERVSNLAERVEL